MGEMKNELLQNITNSRFALEKEVAAMRGELANMKNQGRASDGELLEQKIIRTEQMVNSYKEQWKTQLESHQVSVNVMVQQTVQEQLQKRRDEEERID